MADRTEIKALTGLRGIAAVGVLVYHAMSRGTGFQPLDRLIGHGYIGVDLFFVLSGFVMAMVYGSMVTPDAIWRQQKEFLRYRIARIYPLYATVTLSCFLAAEIGLLHTPGVTNLPYALLSNLLMIQAWGAQGSGLNSPGWSISAEWGAYLLFPLLARATLFSRLGISAGIAGLAAAVIVIMAALPDSAYMAARNGGPLNIAWGPTPAPLIRCLSEFTLGLLAWRLSRHDVARSLCDRNLTSVIPCAAVLVLLLFPRSDALIVLVFPMLVISLGQDRGIVARFMGSAIIYRLGVWSYAIYLVHFPVLEVAPAAEALLRSHGVHFAHSIGHGSMIMVVFVVAFLAHKIVEVPGRRLLRAYLTPRSYKPVAVALARE